MNYHNKLQVSTSSLLQSGGDQTKMSEQVLFLDSSYIFHSAGNRK